jgi:tRNA A58 N-methylase Trm61
MKDPFNHMDEASKHVMDAASVITVLGTLAEMLPAVAALFTIVWTGIRIYETDTVQRLFGRKKDAIDE